MLVITSFTFPTFTFFYLMKNYLLLSLLQLISNSEYWLGEVTTGKLFQVTSVH